MINIAYHDGLSAVQSAGDRQKEHEPMIAQTGAIANSVDKPVAGERNDVPLSGSVVRIRAHRQVKAVAALPGNSADTTFGSPFGTGPTRQSRPDDRATGPPQAPPSKVAIRGPRGAQSSNPIGRSQAESPISTAMPSTATADNTSVGTTVRTSLAKVISIQCGMTPRVIPGWK